MDVTVVIALLCTGLTLYFLSRPPQHGVPSLSFTEYFPGGALHGIIQNPRNFKGTMHALAARYDPVFYSWFGFKRALVTSDPVDISQVLTSEHFGRSSNILEAFGNVTPGGIMTMPREKHRSARRLFRGNMGSCMLQNFEPQINKAVEELCKVLQEQREEMVDISAVLAMTTFRVITNVAFGSDMTMDEREELATATTVAFQEIMKEVLGHPFRKYLGWTGVRKGLWDVKRNVDEMCNAFIRRRIEESKEERDARHSDILDVFLDLDSGDGSVARSLAVEFAMAGSHTSNQMLAWAIYETCCNEHVTKKLEAELERELGDKPLHEPISHRELQRLSYAHKVWRETLRLHPVSAGVSRTAIQNVTLKGSGVRIAKGGMVYVLSSVRTLDASIWNEPHVFKPERWGFGSKRGEGDSVGAGVYLPFGLGFRNCAGKFLADYEGPLILAELLRKFRFRLACEPEEILDCTAFVQMPRYSSKNDGNLDMGVPVWVEMKG